MFLCSLVRIWPGWKRHLHTGSLVFDLETCLVFQVPLNPNANVDHWVLREFTPITSASRGIEYCHFAQPKVPLELSFKHGVDALGVDRLPEALE